MNSYTFEISLPFDACDGKRITAIGRSEEHAFERALESVHKTAPFAALSRVDSAPSSLLAFATQETSVVLDRFVRRIRKASKRAKVRRSMLEIDRMIADLKLQGA